MCLLVENPVQRQVHLGLLAVGVFFLYVRVSTGSEGPTCRPSSSNRTTLTSSNMPMPASLGALRFRGLGLKFSLASSISRLAASRRETPRLPGPRRKYQRERFLVQPRSFRMRAICIRVNFIF